MTSKNVKRILKEIEDNDSRKVASKKIKSPKLQRILAEMGDPAFENEIDDSPEMREYHQGYADYCNGLRDDEPQHPRAHDILQMIRSRHDSSYAKDKEQFSHYVAGFIDADGSISLAAKGSADKFRTPCVEFYNNDITILEKIKGYYGGRIETRKAQKDTHADSYKLMLTGNQALTLISEVWEKMNHLKKKTRAYLINKHYRNCTPRNGKYTDEQLAKKQWLENEVMSIQMRGPEKVLDTA